jgi:hypothetical protein
MVTLTTRPPPDPAELARDFLWLAKRGPRPGTAEHARFRSLRSLVLSAGERFEKPFGDLDPTPGPALEAARWFRSPAEMAQVYRATARGESLYLRCRRPLPAGAWITFAFREGPARLLEMVVVARGPGLMEVQPYRPTGGGLDGLLDAIALSLARRMLAPAPGALTRRR